MIKQKVGKFERQFMVKPGFNWIREEPSRNFGIGSMRIWFVLIGDQGAVQWQIGTEWYPESARRHLSQFPARPSENKPMGLDLGYHAWKPQYEGQSPQDCEHSPTGECYYDGSSLNADYLIEGFLNGGDDWIWNRLEAYYESTFNGKDWPNFAPIIEPHPDDRMAPS